MGKEARLKEVRKQLRNIVKENLAEVMTKELFLSVKSDLVKQVDAIQAYTKSSLEQIDERNKNFHSYITRQLSSSVPILATTPEQLAEAAPLPATDKTD